MAKELRSANQLIDLIAGELGQRDVIIDIRRDHCEGWQPVVSAAPMVALGLQRRAEEIARVLRARYELRV
jgi:hypothetical protein